MLNEHVLSMMTKPELEVYNYNNDSYEQAKDEYYLKHEDPVGFDTGHLTLGDLARIKEAQYQMCQRYEDSMRYKYGK